MKPIQSRFDYACELEGIHTNMPENDYRAQPALSTSDLKNITNPRRFYQRATGETKLANSPALKLGTMFHCYILEPKKWAETYKVCPAEFSDKRTKVGKQWWAECGDENTIREAEYNQLRKMARAFFRLSDTKSQNDWVTELSVFTKDAWPLASKCRIDAYDPKTKTVYDIKTTAPGGASPRAYRYKSIDLKYHWQEWNYKQIAAREGLEIKRWIWLVVETGGDYLAGHYEFDGATMKEAGKEVTKGMATLLQCIDRDEWPDYTPDEAQVISLY